MDITSTTGLQFVHDVGPLDEFHMPQIMGSGAALWDYNGDGLLDILLIGGGPLVAPPDSETPPISTRLYRQQSDGQFVDVTEQSGIVTRGYGMGIAIGDIDNDGDLDLYLTQYGRDQLFENQGDGTFRDITEEAGINNPQWATAASFVDYDQDGWLDLFVVNYVDYLPGSICEDAKGRRDYCGPESFPGTVDRLYRNRGAEPDGPRFQDVTVTSGLAAHAGKGLGMMCRDFTGDHRPDIYVANDMEENVLWIQQPDGTFINEALLRGAAVNRMGEAEASMGVALGDFDDDGFDDMLLTHLSGETNTLYLGDGTGQFVDYSSQSGLAAPSRPFTGFGVVCMDLEHDGDLDVVLVNGRVKRGPPAKRLDASEFWRDYAEPNHVYRNVGQGKFQLEIWSGSEAFTAPVEVSRALVAGDIDNDGDLDLLVSNCGGPARLYRNDSKKAGHWLMIRAVDPELRRDAYGAIITVRAGERTWVRQVNPSASYLSSHDVRVHIGLGNVDHYDSITVDWPRPGGDLEEFPGGAVDRSIVLERGQGTREPSR